MCMSRFVDKIALEEHFATPELVEEGLVHNPGFAPEVWAAIVDGLTSVERRLEEMDRHGIEVAVLSLASYGLQGQRDPARTIQLATAANAALADMIAVAPERLAGFAALPMNAPEAAAEELRVCVTQRGFKGGLVNGFSDTDNGSGPLYYDGEEYWPFWAEAARLGVPIYLHPRDPALDQRGSYAGRPELLGPAWAFGVETATHALRLITSGLFDRLPDLTLILGHLGEMLPFAIHRVDQRMRSVSTAFLQRSPVECLRENFFITTSGNYHTPSLIAILLELGADRVLFAADYPFEDLADGAKWLDALPISEQDRRKIGRDNATRLLQL
jgi:gamma-resorcylate decarboxylase